jgi:hypothetical protein
VKTITVKISANRIFFIQVKSDYNLLIFREFTKKYGRPRSGAAHAIVTRMVIQVK